MMHVGWYATDLQNQLTTVLALFLSVYLLIKIDHGVINYGIINKSHLVD